MRGDVRSEWDEAKQHDVLFLLTIRPPDATEVAQLRTQGSQLNPMELYGLTYVRGCEVIEVKDEGGHQRQNAIHMLQSTASRHCCAIAGFRAAPCTSAS